MKKLIPVLALVLIALGLISPLAHAAKEDVWQMAQSDQYGKKAGGMLGRGLVNATTCFVDVIVQTVDGTKEGTPFVGTLTGLGGGIGCTALRASSGVLDVATFWVPGFNGIPVGKSYSNCLELDTESEATYVAGQEVAPAATPMESQRPAAASRDAMEYVKK